MQFTETETGVFVRVSKDRAEVQQRPQQSGLIGRVKQSTCPPKSLLKGELQRFLFMSRFRNRTAAVADGNVTFGSDSILSHRRPA